ncbi:hypothetical protein FYK55_07090 [Roseiconus nitratireducens]|uniref:Phage major capsid protein n=1 Tax=Roseiconus nitratireducens TaxID=2605748 RepID=A0A5M6DGT2_9BACT|nr:hypothetical protein [Roseiconus nitratireducens]KAA5545409.1 hypothetical protein FYK55_07090 [Roseiconus nitratireducens]
MARSTLSDVARIEAALATEYGISDETQAEYYRRNDYSDSEIEKLLNEASSREYVRRASLTDLAACIVETLEPSFREFKPVPLFKKCQDIQAEFGDNRVHASTGVSTVSLPGALGRLANKQLLQSYNEVPAVLSSLAKKVKGRDYQTHTSYRVGLNDLLDEVSPGGEVRSTSMTESGYDWRPSIHARSLSLAEEMITNDDLSVFLEASRAMGAAGKRRIELELAGLIQDSSRVDGAPTSGEFWFSSGTGPGNVQPNYMVGASSALSLDSLATADAMLRAQLDQAGDPCDLTGTHLLVLGENHVLAKTLYNSTEVRPAGASSTTMPISNGFHRAFEPLTSEWLRSKRLVSPAAGTEWWLVHVGRTHLYQLGFVGSDVPVVETFEHVPNMLGITMRAKLSFGVSLMDPRAAVYSKGAA